jgi:hypothetical protein
MGSAGAGKCHLPNAELAKKTSARMARTRRQSQRGGVPQRQDPATRRRRTPQCLTITRTAC